MKHACGPYFDLVRKMESERRYQNQPRVGYSVADASPASCVLKQTEEGRATWERNHLLRKIPLTSAQVPLAGTGTLNFTLGYIIDGNARGKILVRLKRETENAECNIVDMRGP